jgi:O-antigen/teichoic acid export membrane protein
MSSSQLTDEIGLFQRLRSDQGLTKKASLNAFASGLDYGARLVVGFFVTPFLVTGLGNSLFGTWQVLLRLTMSISPASGRATQALKWILASEKTSSDYDAKRRYVGSAIVVWALFLPIMVVLGVVVVWFLPSWIKTPPGYIALVRIAAAVLVANLVVYSLASLPQSVLEGENLGYKRMGLSAILVLVGGGFTCLAVFLKTGIVGVAAASLATTIMTGAFFFLVVRSYAPWFGVARPNYDAVRKFFGLSGWFLSWHLIMNLMTAGDVVLLGMLKSVESVTTYSLIKYAPETLITFVEIMVFGIGPGLGGIIGSGDLQKAARVRGEAMQLTWLVVTTIGATLLFWNRAFVSRWVGTEYHVGPLITLLIMVVIFQFVLIRNDAHFIDLTLRLRNKVLLGGLSVTISLFAAALLVGYFNLGIAGLCLGLIAGRLILSLGYPVLIGRFFGVPLSSQLRGVLRPGLVAILLLGSATWLRGLAAGSAWIIRPSWFFLALYMGTTLAALSPVAFYCGLSGDQRRQIMGRVLVLLGRTRA